MIRDISGYGYSWPPMWGFDTNSIGYYVIDADGEKWGMVGRVWAPGWVSGSKNVRRVILRCGGSVVTTSKWRVSTQTVADGRPDLTQDEYADVTPAGNAWIRTGTLSLDRAVNPYELVGVVVEFDPAGRKDTNSMNIGVGYSGLYMPGGSRSAATMFHTGSAWSLTDSRNPKVMFEDEYGGYIGLRGSWAAEASTQSLTDTTGAGAEFTVVEPLVANSMWAVVTGLLTTETLSIELYNGNTRLWTKDSVQYPGDALGSQIINVDFPPTLLLPGNTYRLSLEPVSGTAATLVTHVAYDVATLALMPGGSNWRLNTVTIATPAWGTVSTTTAPLMGLYVNKVMSGSKPNYVLGM